MGLYPQKTRAPSNTKVGRISVFVFENAGFDFRVSGSTRLRGGGAPRRRARDGAAPAYRGTSPIRKRPPVGAYRRPMPRVLEVSDGDARFL